MRAKFTPGPWWIDDIDDDILIIIGPRRGHRHGTNKKPSWEMARIDNYCFWPEDEDEDKANARLITAAPDLYAACEAMINCQPDQLNEVHHMCVAATKKARGES